MMKIKLTFLLLSVSVAVFAQDNLEDKRKNYDTIVQSGTLAQKEALAQDLLAESKSIRDEQHLGTISSYLYRLGQQESADSLNSVIAKKFPKGLTARGQYIQQVYYQQEGAKAKEKSYQHIVKTWPIPKNDEIKIAYDYVIADLAKAFIDEGNKDKALFYLDALNERFWRAQGYIPVATKLLQQGDTATALPLIQTAIQDAEYFIQLPKDQQDNRAGFAAVGYPGYVGQLADIYMHQGQDQEALELVEHAVALAPESTPRFSASYFKLLENADRKLEALQQLEMLYESGNFTFKDNMKELYVALNGTDKGYEAYTERLNKNVVKSIREHIAKNEVFKLAPDFELLNLKGESVSLASLKGKVVVLDFWATWCGPCINSFPGMQAAQEMYADDPDVQFLFINTWERDKNYKENVAAFIENNQYPFEVLFDDQKDPETGEVLAAKFNVSGIPAKFILDKEGNIRYALTGSSSNVDYVKLEMRELIEAAREPYKDAE